MNRDDSPFPGRITGRFDQSEAVKHGFTSAPSADRARDLVSSLAGLTASVRTPERSAESDRASSVGSVSAPVGVGLLLFGPGESALRTAFDESGPYLDAAAGFHFHLVSIGDPRCTGAVAWKFLEARRILRASLVKEWSGQIDTHGSPEQIATHETFVASEAYGVALADMPCLLVFPPTGDEQMHIGLPKFATGEAATRIVAAIRELFCAEALASLTCGASPKAVASWRGHAETVRARMGLIADAARLRFDSSSDTDPRLGPRHFECLEALAVLGARSPATRKTAEIIAEKAVGVAEVALVKEPLADLVAWGYARVASGKERRDLAHPQG